ncbi:acetyltransferase, GNAT family [Sporothrix schenckii 1099-18]|uniref:N-acetyltransferase domain-containing protein n=2 Tax=Sporothrix schenckii TaxID=29908 RepID=U7PJS1_SPOS1|nr:acetyltransferase, GNAT family [Sporothrix schenckii 1099-18]ERS95176.1 hypothetical protein HMPREF1624_08387 [Sporothrix schenckii ATCC 58251]KJR89966.1 acetyltransferase, GNAT family [Sporothrix schenckii 1099-18]
MALTMRAGTLDDVDQLVEVYMAAFANNGVQKVVFPPTSTQVRPFWRQNLTNNLTEDDTHVRVMETAATDAGPKAIVAFAVWNAPRKPTDPIPSMPPRDAWPSDGDPDAAVEFFHDLERQHRRYMAHPTNAGQQQPHWYLELIATHPAHQGKGAAGALLRWAEQQADAQQVPCYLDATPDGRPVYTSKGHGYRELEMRRYFGGVYEHVYMIRDPR